ncbi:RTA1-domain-containing protein [Agrocybe pediades]|nr:RTA1-domain-containing protein [Agrocybe pediades]
MDTREIHFDPDYKHAAFALYRYAPSLAGCIVFCVLFTLTTGLHSLQLFRTRTWYMIPFAIGGLFELVGYAARAVSASQEPGFWTLLPYILQSVFLLVAPALFAASIYMILGRIILLTDGEKKAIIRRSWLTKLFVSGDVLSFLMQSTGGALMATASSDPSKQKLGENVIIGGLFVQLIVFGLFIVVAGIFHLRLARSPTAASRQPHVRWRTYLTVLYTTSFLILIRSLFRVIEYLQGYNGFLLTTEAFLYVFDATLMFLTMAVMNWQHPSEIGMLLRGDRPLDGSGSFRMVGFHSVKEDASPMMA